MYRLYIGFKGKFAAVAVAILSIALTGTAFAGNPNPTSFTPTAGQALVDLTGTNNGYNEAGVYTSPYYGTITTAGPNSATISTAMICDDYYDDSYLQEEWVANVTQVSSLTGTQTFSNTTPSVPTPLYDGTTWNGQQVSQTTEYMTIAYLSEELLATTNPQAQADYGFAIWDFTDPNGNVLSGVGDVSVILSDITNALNSVQTLNVSDFSNVTIYSYAGEGVQCTTQSQGCQLSPPPQEFIVVSMAEPSMPLQMLFYGSCTGGLFLLFRRRQRSVSKLQ